ncbi:hypothetical protein PHYPO_G00106910 [Pangasianodon hypophthalmus]|uniref:Uncharacterized protein n=1 Tax=Pangasianodon hypophthalmus TaxID=310915 RepID=A0A5N5PXE4_PANHP|nr:hypothetical protein PHYPO_G00106910 [Pangasianodon hypophthalmus]
MREDGQWVQPNLSRFSVSSIVRTFRQHNRTDSGRWQMFHVYATARGINSGTLSTIDCISQRKRVHMKQVYRVPFERNSERVKVLCFLYVQVMAASLLQHLQDSSMQRQRTLCSVGFPC